MRIEYIGHSCFYIVTNDGVRMIIDPYDDSIGLTHIDREADIVLITHHHFDHDNLGAVRGEYDLIEVPGEWEIDGVRISGYPIPHDHSEGMHRGMVTSYLIEADNSTILHLGDVGGMPPDSFFNALPDQLDVLMVPVGGNYTVNAREALDIASRIDPSAVIPMHYKTNRLKVDIAPPDEFIRIAHGEFDVQRRGNTLDIPQDIHKKRGRVVVMENSF